MPQPKAEHVLTLSCADRRGIVHAVSGALLAEACNILDSQLFGAPDTGRFFMRVHFAADDERSPEALAAAFAPIGDRFEMAWDLHDLAHRPRILIMVSRLGHCLNDLLYRQSIGALRADVAAVVSNHADFAGLAATYGVPFHHLPVTAALRDAAEERLLQLVSELEVELVVLARYMQVLGPATSDRMAGREKSRFGCRGGMPMFAGGVQPLSFMSSKKCAMFSRSSS